MSAKSGICPFVVPVTSRYIHITDVMYPKEKGYFCLKKSNTRGFRRPCDRRSRMRPVSVAFQVEVLAGTQVAVKRMKKDFSKVQGRAWCLKAGDSMSRNSAGVTNGHGCMRASSTIAGLRVRTRFLAVGLRICHHLHLWVSCFL